MVVTQEYTNMAVDWKYKIRAVNPCSGNEHTEDDAILFLAKVCQRLYLPTRMRPVPASP
jgi:hypothetical protein